MEWKTLSEVSITRNGSLHEGHPKAKKDMLVIWLSGNNWPLSLWEIVDGNNVWEARNNFRQDDHEWMDKPGRSWDLTYDISNLQMICLWCLITSFPSFSRIIRVAIDHYLNVYLTMTWKFNGWDVWWWRFAFNRVIVDKKTRLFIKLLSSELDILCTDSILTAWCLTAWFDQLGWLNGNRGIVRLI